MKKINPFIILSILLLIGLVFFATQYFFPKISKQEQALWLNANEVNKTCPIQVDDATRLDNATVYPNNVYQYNYTLFNLNRTDINSEMATKSIEPKIIASIKKDPEFQIFRKAQTTINYNYKDRNGQFVFKIVITPDKYK